MGPPNRLLTGRPVHQSPTHATQTPAATQSAIHTSTYVAEDDPPVSFEDVSTAMYRIRNGIVRTPCYRSHFLSELCGTNIYVKNEVQ